MPRLNAILKEIPESQKRSEEFKTHVTDIKAKEVKYQEDFEYLKSKYELLRENSLVDAKSNIILISQMVGKNQIFLDLEEKILQFVEPMEKCIADFSKQMSTLGIEFEECIGSASFKAFITNHILSIECDEDYELILAKKLINMIRFAYILTRLVEQFEGPNKVFRTKVIEILDQLEIIDINDEAWMLIHTSFDEERKNHTKGKGIPKS